MEHNTDMNDEEKEHAKKDASIVNCNLSMVYLKRKEYSEAVTTSQKVLDFDSNNLKALIRHGHGSLQLGDWDVAKTDFKKALTVDPHNKVRYILMWNIFSNLIK